MCIIIFLQDYVDVFVFPEFTVFFVLWFLIGMGLNKTGFCSVGYGHPEDVFSIQENNVLCIRMQ